MTTDYLLQLETRLADVPEILEAIVWPDHATTIYLTGCSTVESRAADRHNLGVLAQPGNAIHQHAAADYGLWGADNGCFAEAQGKPWDHDGWLRWLEQLDPAGLLFATAPDVVGDAAATLQRSARYLPIIRRLGIPAALVAQDGLEELEVPWDSFDVLFIGGSTEWKLSEHAARLAREARARGKWVHVGRVNSWRRIDLVRAWADSVDGTYLAFGPRANWPKLAGWLDRLDVEGGLEAGDRSLHVVELAAVAA